MQEIIEYFTQWPSDSSERFGFILGWIILVMVSGLIIYGLLELINSVFLPVQEGYGVIIQKNFIPSHHTTTLVPGAKGTLIPITTWHPDAWSMIISADGKNGTFYIDETGYVRYNIHQKVKITYSIGRIWGTLNIKSIQ